GPTLGNQGRVLKSGERLQVASTQTATQAEQSPAIAAVEPSATNEPADASAAKPDAPSSKPRPSGAWRELARARHYDSALAVAEGDGFDAICSSATPGDLILLGNAARFAGSLARSEQAFRSVRARFAGTPESSLGALLLGRIAYDQRGDLRDAERWFRAYLREAPVGNLAREAEGRLLEAQRGLGEMAAARATASSYIAKYPSGSHASLARQILNEE
ncbi:MAG TPA: tetratricopeptide repeat protein, partial [Polyangiaceae bacterium]|nr:tetratricopeptide repeat protein [Polyangiaceae bacterium]